MFFDFLFSAAYLETKPEAINSSNAFSGYTYSQINSVKEYFGLQQKNEDLARENARLKEILFNKLKFIDK